MYQVAPSSSGMVPEAPCADAGAAVTIASAALATINRMDFMGRFGFR